MQISLISKVVEAKTWLKYVFTQDFNTEKKKNLKIGFNATQTKFAEM